VLMIICPKVQTFQSLRTGIKWNSSGNSRYTVVFLILDFGKIHAFE
jgi:hypothetical protein